LFQHKQLTNFKLHTDKMKEFQTNSSFFAHALWKL